MAVRHLDSPIPLRPGGATLAELYLPRVRWREVAVKSDLPFVSEADHLFLGRRAQVRSVNDVRAASGAIEPDNLTDGDNRR